MNQQPIASLINLADVRKDNALSKQDHECPQWNQAAILERHHEETKGSQGPDAVYEINKIGTHDFHVSFFYQKNSAHFDGEHYYSDDAETVKTFNGKNWS